MTNRDLARIFNKLGKVLEIHGENPFKIRSYTSAYNTLRRYGDPIIELNRDQLLEIKGIGKNIADKILELQKTGAIASLDAYIAKTPPGIVEMLDIKGLGAKKILLVWQELGIESPGELLYACEENRLIELKGFGEKTQKSLKEQLIYFMDGQGKYLYGHVEAEGEELLSIIREEFPDELSNFVGDFGRKMPIVDGIEILSEIPDDELNEFIMEQEEVEELDGWPYYRGTKVILSQFRGDYAQEYWEAQASEEFLAAWKERYPNSHIDTDQQGVFAEQGIAFIPTEARESAAVIDSAAEGDLNIIEPEHIKGVVHNHSTYSDGVHTIRQMADACVALGYEYLVMSDHSQSAFYADGLKPDKVYQQMAEIDELNKDYENFKIYKSIESDILSNGGLDYEDDLLAQFDLVIASVHSNLKMDEEKANMRLLKAIAHPATRILGHPTGRLLLSRPGYPIDHKLIIDACAEYNVAIELNANPYRLDLDWSWIPYAMDREVLVAINPDAHSMAGIKDIRYGVIAARKACLQPHQCLNTKDRSAFEMWIASK